MALAIVSIQSMTEQVLFRQTRWRLAGWYAGVMGMILSLSGVGVYEAIDHAHRTAADQELQAIAERLHETLEPLKNTDRLSIRFQNGFPEPCIGDQCRDSTNSATTDFPVTTFQPSTYMRLLSPSGKRMPITGLKSQGLPPVSSTSKWQTLTNQHQVRYRQITLPLQPQNETLWGYIQVGTSLESSDEYLTSVRIVLFVGLPLALVFVGIASWGLAERALRPIQQSYQQMQQFTADAAHELRTPIAAAQATVEAVLDTPTLSEAETRETLEVLDRQHQRLSKLIQDLLLLTRLDRQTQLSQEEVCCVQDLVNDIAEEVAALALNHQIQLTIDLQVDRPLQVKGNEAQLYRLVFNLVINAIEHTPEGGEIVLSLDEHDQHALIQVRDTGKGIAQEYHSKIFDRFYRIDSDRSRQSGGSGLGLAIAQAIAQTHKGKIVVQSIPHQGSIFSVYLPLSEV